MSNFENSGILTCSLALAADLAHLTDFNCTFIQSDFQNLFRTTSEVTFRFQNTFFYGKKWPSEFQKWFRHEKKPIFNFQTWFFHGKNGYLILNISVRSELWQLFHFKPIGNLAGNRINNPAASLPVTIGIHGLAHAGVGHGVI